MKFSELSEKAKQKALEKMAESVSQDFNYHAEYVIEDAKTIGKLFGLEISNVYYSGFWSQGDGASIDAEYSYKPGGLKAVKAYAPKDEELHRIVSSLQDVQRRHFYKLFAKSRQNGFYMSNMSTEVSHTEDNYKDVGSAEDDIAELLQDYADWIYRNLEKEYEYQTSREALIESIDANEYEFDEEGNLQ